MITKNFEDYPEHRLKFFSLLRAIAAHCFPALIRLSSPVCVFSFPFCWLYPDSRVCGIWLFVLVFLFFVFFFPSFDNYHELSFDGL